MVPRTPPCLTAAVAVDPGELLAEHDSALRGRVPAHPRLGTVVERIGPLILTHYGTHCVVDHAALHAESEASASASTARLVAQVQASAAERVEPVQWRVFAHDAAASQLSAALDAAGFAAGRERSVLVGAVDELDFPQPPPESQVESVAWDGPEAQRALESSADSGPHRVPLAVWHAMGCSPYWDVDARVLTHQGKVTAARPELLAQLLLWRFRPPTKRFLVADTDACTDTGGEVHRVLLAAGFREVTSVRSHHWTPPGEPVATPPARHTIHNSETELIARCCEARIGFTYASGSGRYSAPVDSRRWFYGMLDGRDDPAIAAAERIIERGLRACVRPGEWVYEYRPYLNGREFDPHRVGGPGQPPWPGRAVADDEFQFLATADARLGTFGHYLDQTLVVFGDDLIEQVAGGLDRLLGAGVWTFD